MGGGKKGKIEFSPGSDVTVTKSKAGTMCVVSINVDFIGTRVHLEVVCLTEFKGIILFPKLTGNILKTRFITVVVKV